ncbi:MAG: TrmB family transcriptional regulator [Candidatus Hodarchaeota archaeon]
MENRKKIIELFKNLELSQYEAQVFLELFKKSPQTARSLSKASEVSRGRIYDVLKSLNEKGLVLEMPSRGTPNLYNVSSFPQCLEKLRDKKIETLNIAYDEITNLLSSVERELSTDAEALDMYEIAAIRGETAIDYYIKKLIEEAQHHILTNFPTGLLLEYQSNFIKASDRQIQRTFIMPEVELPKVQDIVRGAEVYVLDLEEFSLPLLTVFKDARPSMLIADDKIGIITFYGHSDNALLIRSPEFLKYQTFILSLFMQAGKKEHID